VKRQNEEFGLRLRWFTPVEILRQATSTAADLLALSGPRNPYPEGRLGRICEGAYADLLIVEGDPLSDIRVLERPSETILVILKDGRVYKNQLK
jgi:imidazolonepropionase-like amidohydrolase